MTNGKLETTLKAIRPEEYMFAFFALLLIVLLIIYRIPPSFTKGTMARMLVPFLLFLLFGFIANRKKFHSKDEKERRSAYKTLWTVTRDWSPFVLLILVYENLHDLVKTIRPEPVDGTLMWIDEKIFGIEPTLWLDKFINPVAVDWFAFTYALYFFLPATLAFLVYYKKRYGDFRDLCIAMVISFYVGFIGYMLVPAVGPRYELVGDFHHTLEGVFFYDTTKDTWSNLEHVHRDCFPSLHTAQSTISLYFAWKFKDLFPIKRLMFWIYLPLVVSLWFSTIYLRYHWFIDLVAGWLLAMMAILVAMYINYLWNKHIHKLPKNEKIAKKEKRKTKDRRTGS